MHPGLPLALVLTAAALTALVAQGPVVPSPTATLPASLKQQIDTYLRSLEPSGFSGALLIATRGEVFMRKGYGHADRERNARVTPETVFDIGSITKPMTASAIWKLESQGRLAVTDALSKFFEAAPADKKGITIQQVLAHTAGFPDALGDDYDVVTREWLLEHAFGAPLLFPPGEKNSYSNVGYSILAAIIEKTSGRPYERYVYDEVLAPAGLKKTGYTIPKWDKAELAVGYENGQRWGTPLDHAWLPDGPGWHLRGNGGILSNVDELYQWLMALDAGKVLGTEARAKFFERYARPAARGQRRAVAIGGNGIFNAIYSWWIDDGVLIVMMTNVDKFPSEEIVPKIEAMLFAESKR